MDTAQQDFKQNKQLAADALMLKGHNNFLNDLFKLRDSRDKLKMEILKRGDEFLTESCLKQLTTAQYPWLNDSLLELRLSPALSL